MTAWSTVIHIYEVTAHNLVGESAAVERSVMPAAIPGSPTNVQAAGGFQQISVSWTPPVVMGGGIQHYRDLPRHDLG